MVTESQICWMLDNVTENKMLITNYFYNDLLLSYSIRFLRLHSYKSSTAGSPEEWYLICIKIYDIVNVHMFITFFPKHPYNPTGDQWKTSSGRLFTIYYVTTKKKRAKSLLLATHITYQCHLVEIFGHHGPFSFWTKEFDMGACMYQ